MDGDGPVRDLASVDVTALLGELSKGRPEVADQLIPVVYGELQSSLRARGLWATLKRQVVRHGQLRVEVA